VICSDDLCIHIENIIDCYNKQMVGDYLRSCMWNNVSHELFLNSSPCLGFLVHLFARYMHSINSVLSELENLYYMHLHVLEYHWVVHFQTYWSNFVKTLTLSL
jgi:hypothetical protein